MTNTPTPLHESLSSHFIYHVAPVYALAGSIPLISVDTPRIKQIALSAKTAKYKDVKRDNLKFSSILFSVQSDDSESLITAVYQLNAATNSAATTGTSVSMESERSTWRYR